jgi:hypothetical protein
MGDLSAPLMVLSPRLTSLGREAMQLSAIP